MECRWSSNAEGDLDAVRAATEPGNPLSPRHESRAQTRDDDIGSRFGQGSRSLQPGEFSRIGASSAYAK